MLNTLPDSPERAQQELDLQIALGNALVATKGYAAPEVGQTYNWAQELSQQVEEPSQRFAVLQGLHRFYLVRAELRTARELGEQLLSLAQNVQDPILLTEAHCIMGTTFHFLGEFAPALEHLQEGLRFYDRQQHRSYVLLYGQDPGMVCLAYEGWVLWLLGYPEQALKKSYEAISLAQELSHPYSLAYAMSYAATIYTFCQDVQAVQNQAEAAIAISNEQGFTIWITWTTFFQGWVIFQQGQDEEGLTQMGRGLTAWRATGANLGQHLPAFLANAHCKAGQVETGLNLVTEALAMAGKTEEAWWKAEHHRLKGELLLKDESRRRKDELAPEGYFLKAIETAQKQRAKSLELRAKVSLARLWQSQGKIEEARQVLADTYGWFTAGFDTPDLKEAKALLDELFNM